MTEPFSADQQEEFRREHEKRERHITPEQERIWADGLMKRLPDSLAYQAACTPEARRAEERQLNQYLELYLRSMQK